MEYKIDKFNGEIKKFLFCFTSLDNHWIYLDLFNDYPNYKTPENSVGDEWWDFTLKEKKLGISNSISNSISISNSNDNKLGSVIKINYIDLRRINTQINQFTKNKKLVYRPTTQTELDEYFYNTDKESDNSKVYSFLKNYYEKCLEHNKNKNRHELVKTTIV